MKKLIVFIFMISMLTSVFATVPIAYTAKLEAPKSIVISAGTDNSITSLHADFTYGLSKSNLHVKLNLEFGFFYLEGLINNNLGEFKEIDLGFSWGARIRTMRGNIEFAPIAIWNMSYQIYENVAIYGGAKLNVDLGTATWSGFYMDFDLNGFIGSQIDLNEKLKLYIEIQPALWSGVNNAYFGVNYYFSIKE